MPTPKQLPPSMDEYLAGVPADKREALERVRKIVHAAAPGATEGYSYGVPAIFLDGKALVGFVAAAKHCALYPMSGRAVTAFAKELAAFSTSAGTIRFQPDQPLPATLLRKIVQWRKKEIAAKAAAGKKPPARSAR